MDLDMMEVYKHLTDAERQEYAVLEETLSSAGWKLLVERAEKELLELMNYGANAPTWDENRTALGRRQVWMTIARLREATDFEYAAKAQERMTAVTETEEVDDLNYE